MNKILITGGSGFIGSHAVDRLLDLNYHVVNLDSLTYAANLKNNLFAEKNSNYTFIKGDIKDIKFLHQLFEKYKFNKVIHFAAESHVDNSIKDPFNFVKTNVEGSLNLLEVCKVNWKNNFTDKFFYHISTDEVFGSLNEVEESWKETSPYDPRSPYSASKASSDHFVRAYYHTYGLPIKISNCSNNFGPRQHKEKLIPLIINNIIHKKQLPIYGDGKNIRDWLYVDDHIDAIDVIFHKGKIGETYNIGSNQNLNNISIAKLLLKISKNKISVGENVKLKFIKDRPGHDLRYSLNSDKIKKKLKWSAKIKIEEGLKNTFNWYLENKTYFNLIKKKDILKRLGKK